jgi:hypothetical protein
MLANGPSVTVSVVELDTLPIVPVIVHSPAVAAVYVLPDQESAAAGLMVHVTELEASHEFPFEAVAMAVYVWLVPALVVCEFEEITRL